MPNTASAKKRLRQDAVRRGRNRAAKSVLRKHIRQVGEAVAAGDLEKAEAQYRVAAKHLDRAGAKNVIHRNAAARKKSRMQKLILAAKKA
ncbi:MAG: 30S ribosomal protein S20 [Planctomycetota bacterium]